MEEPNSEDEHVKKVLNLIQDWYDDISIKHEIKGHRNFYKISKEGKERLVLENYNEEEGRAKKGYLTTLKDTSEELNKILESLGWKQFGQRSGRLYYDTKGKLLSDIAKQLNHILL